jgi:hypothetical protein
LRILKLRYFFWNSVSSIPLEPSEDYMKVESSSQPFGCRSPSDVGNSRSLTKFAGSFIICLYKGNFLLNIVTEFHPDSLSCANLRVPDNRIGQGMPELPPSF